MSACSGLERSVEVVRLITLTSLIPDFRQGKSWRQEPGELKQNPWFSLPLACSPFLIKPRCTFAEMVLPTMHWTLPFQSENCSPEMPIGQLNGDKASTEILFSQVTLVCIN